MTSMATWATHSATLAAAVLLLAASQGAKADYWVRGEAVLKGSGIPAACGAVGKAFS
jgi:hypothetical protein